MTREENRKKFQTFGSSTNFCSIDGRARRVEPPNLVKIRRTAEMDFRHGEKLTRVSMEMEARQMQERPNLINERSHQ